MPSNPYYQADDPELNQLERKRRNLNPQRRLLRTVAGTVITALVVAAALYVAFSPSPLYRSTSDGRTLTSSARALRGPSP
jgi:hypothetical protein